MTNIFKDVFNDVINDIKEKSTEVIHNEIDRNINKATNSLMSKLEKTTNNISSNNTNLDAMKNKAIYSANDRLSKISSNQNTDYAKKVNLRNELNKIAKESINTKLENILEQEIRNIKRKYPNLKLSKDSKVFDELRSTIRGHTSFKNFQKIIIDTAEKELSYAYLNIVDKQEKMLYSKIDSSFAKLDNATKRLDDVFLNRLQKKSSELDKLEKLLQTPDDLTNKIVNRLNPINKIQNKVDRFVDRIDTPFRKLGIDIGTNQIAKALIGKVEKDINDSLNRRIKPLVDKNIKSIIKRNEQLKKLHSATIKARQDFDKIKRRWENTARDYVQKHVGKIAKNLVSKIKIKF